MGIHLYKNAFANTQTYEVFLNKQYKDSSSYNKVVPLNPTETFYFQQI